MAKPRGIGRVIIVCLVSIACHRSDQRTPEAEASRTTELTAPWPAYLGAHDRVTAWAKSVRGIGRAELNGFSASAAELNEFTRRLLPVVRSGRTVVMPVGGMGPAYDMVTTVRFLDQVVSDRGQRWRSAVLERCGVANLAHLEQDSELLWQVGNEINSRHYAAAITRWRTGQVVERRNLHSTIPIYVEYFLAPTVRALRECNDERTEGQQPVAIMLGSIANAADPLSREWLDTLLTYRLKGLIEPELRGTQVWELVDVISIHYLVTAMRGSWSEVLDSLQAKWVLTGRVAGIWATEELGAQPADKALGAATTLRILARYLHWWTTRSIDPNRSRAFFWGTERGPAETRGRRALDMMVQRLGEARLRNLTDASGASSSQGGIETYVFKAPHSKQVIIFLVRTPWGSSRFPARFMVLPAYGIGDFEAASMHVFNSTGHDSLTARVNRAHDSNYVSIPERYRTNSPATLLFFFQSPPSAIQTEHDR